MLVADDSAALRRVVRITLTSQGWEIIEADTAEKSREMTRAERPDLVLLDITFGEVGPDGLAICAELKSDPATSGIPIVILTAHDDPAERRRATAARADAFIAKPFGPLDLLNVIRSLTPLASAAPALGVYLLDSGAVQPTQLEAALDEQRALETGGSPRRLGDVLLDKGAVTTLDLERALVQQMRARSEREEAARSRVLLVDDHAAVRSGLRQLIATSKGLAVVAEAENGEAALRMARLHRPHVIVLDQEMPGTKGLELIAPLRAEVPGVRIVMFSMDAGIAERALAHGADAALSKDASATEILHALETRREPVVPAQPGGLLPRFDGRRSLRRSAAILAGLLGGYVVLFLLVQSEFGASAATFSVAPVAIAGALLGPEAGVIAAVLTVLLNILLWSATGHAAGEPVLAIGSQGLGIIVLLLLGLGSGSFRLLGYRIDPHRRRVEAIAEAARALGGMTRTDFISVFLEAMLRVVPGDVALLYANVGGAPLLVGSVGVTGWSAPERLDGLARDAMRDVSPQVVDAFSESERPYEGMASAALVPVMVGGQDVRGVVVVLHGETRRYGDAELAQIRPFAQYLWIVLRSAPAGSLVAHSSSRRLST